MEEISGAFAVLETLRGLIGGPVFMFTRALSGHK